MIFIVGAVLGFLVGTIAGMKFEMIIQDALDQETIRNEMWESDGH